MSDNLFINGYYEKGCIICGNQDYRRHGSKTCSNACRQKLHRYHRKGDFLRDYKSKKTPSVKSWNEFPT